MRVSTWSMKSAVRSPGRMPGMKPPCFFRLSAVSVRVEHDRRVEEGEEDDQRRIQEHVGRPAMAEIGRQRRDEAGAVRGCVWKLAMVAGSSSSEEAKIGGITPEVFSLSGRNEVWPSYIRLPTWRFG